MAIELKLDAFEGPLDLLLHLIEKNKVSIYDIPIALITEQYMEYIDAMTEAQLQMDVMSEFLVMAATLLDIKSRMLLPAEKDEEGEEIDPREELVRQLLEYKTYKYMSFELREREETAQGVWYRRQSIPRQVQQYREPVDPDEVLDKAGVTLPGLYRIFQEVMKRREDLRDPIRAGFGKIEKQQIDTQEAMQFVERYIMNRRRCTFRSLLMLREGRMYTVVTFLTILELMKRGRVYVTQESNFGEINIEANDPSQWNDDEDDFISEWSEDSDLAEGDEHPDGTAEA
ncbi:MAG: segregation/condensation protein A [Lachnospiraceae bacterium]|nr:segregation/condensation protein A [Lachnospiraceae bacterium]